MFFDDIADTHHIAIVAEPTLLWHFYVWTLGRSLLKLVSLSLQGLAVGCIASGRCLLLEASASMFRPTRYWAVYQVLWKGICLAGEVLFELLYYVCMLVDQNSRKRFRCRVGRKLGHLPIDSIWVLANGQPSFLVHHIGRFKNFMPREIVICRRWVFPFQISRHYDSKFDFIAFVKWSDAFNSHIWTATT